MKRKVVLHGPSTLTISLPYSWIRKFNIKKGQELNVEECGKELVIKIEEEPNLEKREINIGNLKRVGKAYTTASYRQGFDEISLIYDENKYLQTIQEVLLKETLGFEIVKQGKNNCIIKDLTGLNKYEFDSALNRTWLLLLDLAKESLEAVKDKNEEQLKNIRLMDFSINKFANYCLRILTKKGHSDFKKTPLYYHLIKSLEEIADNYKDICFFYSANLEKINPELIFFLKETNSNLEKFYKIFYKYEEQRLEELLNETKETINKINNSKSSLDSSLSTISKQIRNLSSVLLELSF